MNDERVAEMQRTVFRVVKWWVKRHRWAETQVPDLLQEAAIAVIQAEPSYDPALGPFKTFAGQISERVLRRSAWRNRGPVTHARGAGALSFARGDQALEDATHVLGSQLPPDEEAHRNFALAQVAKVMRKLDSSRGKLAVARFTLGPREAARRGRVPVQEVYAATKKFIRRAAKSKELRAIHKEMHP